MLFTCKNVLFFGFAPGNGGGGGGAAPFLYGPVIIEQHIMKSL